jgi:hypothetical protein
MHKPTRGLLNIARAIEVAPIDWPRRDVYAARAAHLAQSAPSKIVSLGGKLPSAAIVKDGSRILVIREGGRAEIRDANTGALILTLVGETKSALKIGEMSGVGLVSRIPGPRTEGHFVSRPPCDG